jgi:signal transduction histidine kinase
VIHDLIRRHLFENAPMIIAVLDRDFRVALANARFEAAFGAWQGQTCFALLKKRGAPCPNCMALKTFEDGRIRIHEEVLGVTDGRMVPFVTRVAPLAADEEEPGRFLIWMASDVNEAASLQIENEVLFERVPCYVTVLDRDLRIVRANKRMRETFGGHRGEHCYQVYKRQAKPCPECPALKAFEDGADHISRQVGITTTGIETHYLVKASPLVGIGAAGGTDIRYVVEMSSDVTELHQLEREKMEVERLAAVGQTVAGLAHGMKNILMGMEGGIYVMSSGLERDQPEKVQRGMKMLESNVGKISNLVKNLLSFSKGAVPKVALVDPNAIASEILELYGGSARQAGIELVADLQPQLQPAPLDEEGIHTCLANLVSNAIDACQASEREQCRVVLSTAEKEGSLCFAVSDDGCGMDYEVKRRIFTTFFTTKGGGGTGLGLLMTRKIVQEHGGKIVVESEPNQGTVFRIILPRARLPHLPQANSSAGDGAKSISQPDGP